MKINIYKKYLSSKFIKKINSIIWFNILFKTIFITLLYDILVADF